MEITAPKLEPLPYHGEMRRYLKSHERDLWDWFASAGARADYTENLRLELLKVTYRLDPDSHASLYDAVHAAKDALQLNIPVTLYQAQNSPALNASLYFIPGEAHIVFSGQALTLLNPDELKAIIGHELAHYILWSLDDGEFHTADRLLEAAAADPRASASHTESARRYQLYTEIFADRGSLCATQALDPVIAGLVKIETGLSSVSGAGYLKQAEEIFDKARPTTEGLSHPEAFIRTRALSLWQERGLSASTQIAEMIEGSAGIENLDLLGQEGFTAATRQVLQCLLEPGWFQTPVVLGHARLFFDDFEPAKLAQLPELLKTADPKTREYLCYLLLDFVTADPELDDMPLAAALNFCRRVDLDSQFEKLAIKELKLKARDLKRLKEKAPEMLAKAEGTL